MFLIGRPIFVAILNGKAHTLSKRKIGIDNDRAYRMVSIDLATNEIESDTGVALYWPVPLNDQIKEEDAAKAKSDDNENGYESENLVPVHFPSGGISSQ